MQARASVSKAKSTGRGEVSAETLQGLPSEALWALHTMMVAHFHSDQRGPLTWPHVRLFLLPKLKKPAARDGFRGNSLLSVMSKLYMAGVMILVKQWADANLSEEWSRHLLFGFEAGRKCQDMLMCVQAAVQSTEEWPRDRPLVLCSTLYGGATSFRFCFSGHRLRVPPLLEVPTKTTSRPHS